MSINWVSQILQKLVSIVFLFGKFLQKYVPIYLNLFKKLSKSFVTLTRFNEFSKNSLNLLVLSAPEKAITVIKEPKLYVPRLSATHIHSIWRIFKVSCLLKGFFAGTYPLVDALIAQRTIKLFCQIDSAPSFNKSKEIYQNWS